MRLEEVPGLNAAFNVGHCSERSGNQLHIICQPAKLTRHIALSALCFYTKMELWSYLTTRGCSGQLEILTFLPAPHMLCACSDQPSAHRSCQGRCSQPPNASYVRPFLLFGGLPTRSCDPFIWLLATHHRPMSLCTL